MDGILAASNFDHEFLAAAIADHGLDLNKHSAKQNARCLGSHTASYARDWLTVHCCRGFSTSVKVFAKSTSHRFENWVKLESLHGINDKRARTTPSSRRKENAEKTAGGAMCTKQRNRPSGGTTNNREAQIAASSSV